MCNKLKAEYFEWMYQLTCYKENVDDMSFRKLLTYLHSVDFSYTISMDSNRAEDGVELRYRFGYVKSYKNAVIAEFLDNRPCSVLEMLAALAIRCEEQIMDDPDVGDRTGQWFWGMISNLGLANADDLNFDPAYVRRIVTKFIKRQYKPNGEGGLFTVDHCKHDLRSVEIWYQMCWYLTKLYDSQPVV